MLAEFALRLATGLSVLLLLTPSRLVPPKFFRTHCLIILGLLVLAALDFRRLGVLGSRLYLVTGSAALAYLGSISWGMGLPRLGIPIVFLLAASSSGDLIWTAHGTLEAVGRLASSFLMGSTLTAMLLGHYYLTAPAMSIDPLKRFVCCMDWRWGFGLCSPRLVSRSGCAETLPPDAISPLFLGVRWGVGLVGPTIATWMTWQTVAIRSTQSATGILYIAMTLVLFGELTAMVLFEDSGVMF